MGLKTVARPVSSWAWLVCSEFVLFKAWPVQGLPKFKPGPFFRIDEK
jgi:hypothetical protein